MKIKNFVLLSALGVSLFNPFSISKVSAATSTNLTLSIPKQITLGQNSQGGFKGNFKIETKGQVKDGRKVNISVPTSTTMTQQGKNGSVKANITSTGSNGMSYSVNADVAEKIATYDISTNKATAGTWKGTFNIHVSEDEDMNFGYPITYNLNGGTNASSNPKRYGRNTATFTLSQPTRPGYDFIGWSGTNLNGRVMNPIISKGSSGSRTYTANWKAKEWNYAYTGGVQSFTAPISGKYRLEGWGASGGGPYGGKGGYASGYYNLKQGQTIFAYVGGQGTSSSVGRFGGNGYNGGGAGYDGAYGGGGMTHFAIVNTEKFIPSYSVQTREIRSGSVTETYDKHFDTGTEWGTTKWIPITEFKTALSGTVTINFSSNGTGCSLSGYRIYINGSLKSNYPQLSTKNEDFYVPANSTVKIEMNFHNNHNTKNPIILKVTHPSAIKYEKYVSSTENVTGTLDDIIMIAGGGGGSTSSSASKGGDGGGLIAGSSKSANNFTSAFGGTQSSGYKRFLGESSKVLQPNAGGGAGYWSGKVCNNANGGAGGGSSYIAKVINGKTDAGINSGNGRAKITFVE